MKREPDDTYEMELLPGASRPSCSFPLRSRIVRILGNGYHRDIEIREYQMGLFGLPMVAELAAMIGFILGFVPVFFAAFLFIK